MTVKTISDRVLTLEHKFEFIVLKMEKQLNDVYEMQKEHSAFITNAEHEIERIAEKKITDYQLRIEKIEKSNLDWRKIGVIVSIVGQWALILWIINKIYNV